MEDLEHQPFNINQSFGDLISLADSPNPGVGLHGHQPPCVVLGRSDRTGRGAVPGGRLDHPSLERDL